MSAEIQDDPAKQGTVPADVLSHSQLLEQGGRAAAVLRRLGVDHGDELAVLLPMCLESVVVTLACIRTGALRTAIPSEESPAAARQRIRASGAAVVITADNSLTEDGVQPVKTWLDRALVGCPGVRHVLVVPQVARPVPWVPGRDRWWHEELAREKGGAHARTLGG